MNTINNAAVEAAEPDNSKGDREIPKLQTKKKSNNVKRLAIAGGVLVMVILFAVSLAVFMQRVKDRALEKKAERAKAQPVATAEPAATVDLEAAKKRIEARDEALQAAAYQPPAGQLQPPASAIGVVPAGGTGNFASAKTGANAGGSAPGGQSANTGAQQQPVARRETPTERQLSGDVLVSTGSGGMGGDQAAAGGMVPVMPSLPGMPAMPGLPGQARPEKTALQEQLRPTQLDAVAASKRRSLDFMLLAGTSIPCGQITFINSTNLGQASCVVSKDVYSANGATKLLERGSQALGETLQGLQLGQEMLPVKWNRIVTPKGVYIDINSLATDALGASGLPVYVDNHYGQRFGAAIMLSLIGDLGQAAANKAANAEGTIRLTTTANAGQDLAGRVLEKTINIPPTGYSLHGSATNIFLARDADFGGVYEHAKY